MKYAQNKKSAGTNPQRDMCLQGTPAAAPWLTDLCVLSGPGHDPHPRGLRFHAKDHRSPPWALLLPRAGVLRTVRMWAAPGWGCGQCWLGQHGAPGVPVRCWGWGGVGRDQAWRGPGVGGKVALTSASAPAPPWPLPWPCGQWHPIRKRSGGAVWGLSLLCLPAPRRPGLASLPARDGTRRLGRPL